MYKTLGIIFASVISLLLLLIIVNNVWQMKDENTNGRVYIDYERGFSYRYPDDIYEIKKYRSGAGSWLPDTSLVHKEGKEVSSISIDLDDFGKNLYPAVSFEEAISERLLQKFTADGPNLNTGYSVSIYPSRIISILPFKSDAGDDGYKFILEIVRAETSGHKEYTTYGPVYVFQLLDVGLLGDEDNYNSVIISPKSFSTTTSEEVSGMIDVIAKSFQSVK